MSLIFSGCFKVEESELTPYPGSSQTHCSFNYSETTTLNSTDLSTDFIKEAPPVTYTVSNSTCAGISNGGGSGNYKYVTRIGNTFSFAVDDPYNSRHVISDLTASGNSFNMVEATGCNSYGEQTYQKLTSSSYNNSTKKITLTFFTSVTANGCSASNSSLNYTTLAIDGVYKSACNNGVIKWQYFWQNSTGEMAYYYSNADCSGTKLMYIERNGVFAHRSGGGALKDIDITYHNFLVKIFDTTLKNDFNTNSICSLTSWTTNTDINVKGKNCNFNLLTDAPDTTFTSSSDQIFEKIYSNSSTLYMGDITTGDGSSSSNRPTSYDSTLQYSKDNSIIVKPDWTL